MSGLLAAVVRAFGLGRRRPVPVPILLPSIPAALDDCDALDRLFCEPEQKFTPHSVSATGSARCWTCDSDTPSAGTP